MDYKMSNNNDTPGMQGFDAAAFGLPTGAGGDGAGAGFMYDDGDLAVDESDPIYQATVEAMRARGIEIPKPGEEPRPPAMPTTGDGETPPQGDGAQATGDDPTPPAPLIEDATAGDTPPLQPGDQPRIEGARDTPSSSGETDLDSAPGETGAEGGGPSGTASGTAPSLTFKVDNQDITLNTEQAEYLLRVNSWLENVPEQVKQQWSGIEQGTHVAISAQEYQELQRRAAAPATPQTRTPQAPDLDMLDDETAEYIRSLEARVPAANETPSQDAPPVDVSELQAAFRHQEEQRTRMMAELTATNEKVSKQFGLDEQQLAHLERVTTELQVIPRIAESLTQRSPTGQIIRQAPFGEVVERAYEIAMSQDPALRQIRDEMIYNARVAREAESNRATNEKKAKAGTLAAAPSAAVPANGGAPQVSPDNKMDLQATSAAIAAALTQLSEQS